MRSEFSRSSDSVSSSTVRMLVAAPPPPAPAPRESGPPARLACRLPGGPAEISPPVAAAPDPLPSSEPRAPGPEPVPMPCAVSWSVELSPADGWLLLLPLVDVANWEAAMVSRFSAADCVSSCSFLICWKGNKRGEKWPVSNGFHFSVTNK